MKIKSVLSRIAQSLRIRTKYLWDFYAFELCGFPSVVRGDAISKSLIRKHAPKLATVVDCGSYDGVDAIELYRILKGKVYAFEAMPAVFLRLSKRSRRYRDVVCVPLALGPIDGRTRFYVSGGESDASSSLLAPKDHFTRHPNVSFDNTVEVDVRTLDTWSEENHIGQIDVLWLDMQGAELSMLKASPITLANVTVIHTEVSVMETYDGAPHYLELRNFLVEIGFTVVAEAIPNGADMGNVLFVRLKTPHSNLSTAS